jgi:hypothetical protein
VFRQHADYHSHHRADVHFATIDGDCASSRIKRTILNRRVFDRSTVNAMRGHNPFTTLTISRHPKMVCVATHFGLATIVSATKLSCLGA